MGEGVASLFPVLGATSKACLAGAESALQRIRTRRPATQALTRAELRCSSSTISLFASTSTSLTRDVNFYACSFKSGLTDATRSEAVGEMSHRDVISKFSCTPDTCCATRCLVRDPTFRSELASDAPCGTLDTSELVGGIIAGASA